MSVDGRSERLTTDDPWDCVVIGAGLAGAVVSYLLARGGRRTLLLEAKPFPRPKVCGGCLNERAVGVLQRSGLGEELVATGRRPYEAMRLCAGGRSVRLAIPPGVAVTRETLDSRLVDAAQRVGVAFQAGAAAHVLPTRHEDYREVRIGSPRDARSPVVRARMVLACDGLGRPSLSELPIAGSVVSKKSRVGLGATSPAANFAELPLSDGLLMVVGKQGYVGFSRCEGGILSIAAAVDRRAMGDGARPADVVAGILRDAGLPIEPALADAPWRGTRPLSQRSPRVSDNRLLLLGDAAGYVEPFTGEGMAAALEGAEMAATLAAQPWAPRMADEWQSAYTTSVRSRQSACARLAWLLRRPRLVNAALRLVERWPAIGVRTAQHICSERTHPTEIAAWAPR